MNIYVAAKPGYVKLTDQRRALPEDSLRTIALDLSFADVGWLALVLRVARVNIDVDLDTNIIAPGLPSAR